tara:strand:- start:85 stop:531 length:447 start_codon:yes stop_codon:yes gene_type:complete
MNTENNQKDQATENIPYFKCNKCKYLKRADIFFRDEYKCPKCGSTDLKEIEDNWLSFFTVTWMLPLFLFSFFLPTFIFMYYFWNRFEFLNFIESSINAGTLKMMFFSLLSMPIWLPIFLLGMKFYKDPDKEDGKDNFFDDEFSDKGGD